MGDEVNLMHRNWAPKYSMAMHNPTIINDSMIAPHYIFQCPRLKKFNIEVQLCGSFICENGISSICMKDFKPMLLCVCVHVDI